jgi:hypothetical protein
MPDPSVHARHILPHLSTIGLLVQHTCNMITTIFNAHALCFTAEIVILVMSMDKKIAFNLSVFAFEQVEAFRLLVLLLSLKVKSDMQPGTHWYFILSPSSL